MYRFFLKSIISLVFCLVVIVTNGQELNLEISGTNFCNSESINCDYEGPSLLINEVVLKPIPFDGSFYGCHPNLNYSVMCGGEWIELYNPNPCSWIDISCFVLGNAVPDISIFGAAYVFPQGTLVPPNGFVIVRGDRAPEVPVELLVENGGNVLEFEFTYNRLCLGGGHRFWLPNAGGWLALYDNNGQALDAFAYGNSQGASSFPCYPDHVVDCVNLQDLPSYNEIPDERKTYISDQTPQDSLTLRRMPDGGDWVFNEYVEATYGTSNSGSNTEYLGVCTGTATVIVSGGTPPYSYLWNDELEQITETAVDLCPGINCVTVTDFNSLTASHCIEIVAHLSYIYQDSITICEGETYLWNGVEYSESGIYYNEYLTINDCDSIYSLNLSVQSLPNQSTIIRIPESGILNQDELGSIILSPSGIGTFYSVYLEGEVVVEDIEGTDDDLSLGDDFTAGSYDIYSTTEYGCELFQGTVIFIENEGTNKIVSSTTHGDPASLFLPGETRVSLYVFDSNSDNFVLLDEKLTDDNSLAEFIDLEPGEYYLGSHIVYSENYNLLPHVYYNDAAIHEDAISIVIDIDDIIFANLHHEPIPDFFGTNSGGGTVETENEDKSFDPLSGIVVVLRNLDSNQLIDISITDEEGSFLFESIPDFTNIQVFVSSLLYPNWTAYEFETESEQNYDLSFIVEENSVFPAGITNIDCVVNRLHTLRVHPNPAKDILEIEIDGEGGQLQIFDIKGRKVQSEIISSNREVDISKLNSGTYILILLMNNGEVAFEKLIKE